MSIKKKLFITISAFCLILSFLFVGVWAFKTEEVSFGGDLSYAAKGIYADITAGVLSSTGSFENPDDEDEKMQAIEINTNKKEDEILKDFESWAGLQLNFNENADDVTITFTVTNTSTKNFQFIDINVLISATKMRNATATVNMSRIVLEKGESQEFVVTLSVVDKETNAYINGLNVAFQMDLVQPVSTSEVSYLNYTTSGTNATITGVNDNTITAVDIPYLIKEEDGDIFKVTTVGESAFSGCSQLASITIASSIESFLTNAFLNCSKLKNVSYLGDVNTWANISMSNSASTPNKYISNTFKVNGKELTDVNIGVSTKVSGYAFYGCKNITSAVFGNQVQTLGSQIFNGCSGLKSVVIPASITTLPSYIFQNCTSLTDVNILGDVIRIDNFAFKGCKALETLTLPSTVESLGNQVFYSCANLTTLILNSPTPPTIGSELFVNANKNLVIYVPADSVDAYKTDTTNGWSVYAGQIQAIEE